MKNRNVCSSSVVLLGFVAASLLAARPALAQQTELAKLVASDSNPGGQFGIGVAIDGDMAIVGSSHSSTGGVLAGAAYVFVRVGGAWVEHQKLVASDGAMGDIFGWSVAMLGDVAIVGAPHNDQGGLAAAGAAYVFVRTGGTWVEQQKLVASDSAAGDEFGRSISLSGDAIIIGTPYDDHAGGVRAGSAYVYTRTGGTWVEQQKLVASDAAGGGQFGWSVSISGDAIVLGALHDDHAGGLDAGSAYVFVRTGMTWVEQQKLVASDAAAGDFFGTSVSVSGDTAVIGSFLDDHAGGLQAGSSYVFVWTGTSWVEHQKLVASDAGVAQWFGSSVSMSVDTIVCGSQRDGHGIGDYAGSAYVFVRAGASWVEQQKLVASDAAPGDQFGSSVSMSGGTVLIGAVNDDHAVGTNHGSCYVYEYGENSSPRGVVVIDADNDEDFDAVTANNATDNLSIWSNDGTGVLTETTVALDPADLAPIAIAAGDLDNDGQADDVAVACEDSATVAIVLHVGTTPVASSVPSGGLLPRDVAIGDLDAADPCDDVIVARQGVPISGGSGVAVSLNGGAFVDLVIPGGNATQVVKLAVCDLDGDGDNDLAAIAQASPDQILLFDGDGLGGLTFADAIDLPTSGFANGLCCGDLDGDGDNDLAVVLPALFPPTSDVRVYTYTGSGTLDATDFTAGSDVATSGSFSVDIACGELDGDSFPGFVSRPDLVVVHAGSGDVEAHYGYDAVASTFVSSSALAVGSNPIAVAIGDLNGDCVDDVVVVNQGSNDVSVIFGVVGALAQEFGAGCAGTAGLVPALTSIGAPSVGNLGFGVQLSDALALAPALTLFSSVQSTGVLPGPGGCQVYLAAPASFLRFTNAVGEDSFVFGVPNNPNLLCTELFLQSVVFDASGAFANLLSLSNAVRIRVGN